MELILSQPSFIFLCRSAQPLAIVLFGDSVGFDLRVFEETGCIHDAQLSHGYFLRRRGRLTWRGCWRLAAASSWAFSASSSPLL